MAMNQQVPRSPMGSKPVSLMFRLCVTVLAAASGIVMAASSECTAPSSGSGDATVVTFTYARFGAFVFFVGSTIAAAILEAAGIYLEHISTAGHATTSATADDYELVTEKEYQEHQGIGAAGIALTAVDAVVLALLFSATGAAYGTTATDIFRDQIGSCVQFAVEVERAKILSLGACIAFFIAAVFRPRMV